MSVFKSAGQRYRTTPEILALLEDFRRMVNVCISIGIQQNVSSLKSLSTRAYRCLDTRIVSYYRLCAISAATGILHNFRKAKRKNPWVREPYASRLRLTTCYGFKIQDGFLRLPVKPREYVYVRLNPHILRTIAGTKAGSITVTADSVSICFSKETTELPPEGWIGVDRNLNNATIASTHGASRVYDLSEATRIKTVYRTVKSHFERNDARILRRITRKYGEKQRHRVQPLLHTVSKSIVETARAKRYGIVMERLTNMRRLYRRGNGQGRSYRARMNMWSFGELQRQIEYKARWAGVKVLYVPARGTSKQCSICGYKTLENTQRQLWCPHCGAILDRDESAAVNIAAAGALRFSANGSPVEAVVQEREPVIETLILKVDGDKSSRQPKT